MKIGLVIPEIYLDKQKAYICDNSLAFSRILLEKLGVSEIILKFWLELVYTADSSKLHFGTFNQNMLTHRPLSLNVSGHYVLSDRTERRKYYAYQNSEIKKS